MRVIKADVVGNGHLRAIMAGDDGRSIKTIAFRQAESDLGQAILGAPRDRRSEEHTSELQSLMRISYAVFCLKKKKTRNTLLSIIKRQTNIISAHTQPAYTRKNDHQESTH